MSIFDENNNYIEITKEDISDAAIACKDIDKAEKKRAFANVLGARLGIKFLHYIGTKANNFDSLYTIPAVLKDTDISDITTENNIKIDVRIVEDENHLFIPKSHFKYGITPDMYIFLKISDDSSVANFIGAIAPDEIDKSIENSDYYFITSDTLYNENSIRAALNVKKPQSHDYVDENDILKAESLLINFIDDDLKEEDKKFLYKTLKRSSQCRSEFKEFQKFEIISTDLANSEEILNDSVLDVLGAERIHENKFFEGPHEDIDLDELAELTAADFIEDFIEQHKDSSMSENENIINGEYKELPEDTPIEEAGELETIPSDEELANLSDKNDFDVLSEFSETAENSEELQQLNAIQENDNEIVEDFKFSDESNNLVLDEPQNLELQEEIEDFSFNTEDNLNMPEDSETTPIFESESLGEISETTESYDNNIELSEEIQNDLNANNITEDIKLDTLSENIDLTLPELEPDENLPALNESAADENAEELSFNNEDNEQKIENTASPSEEGFTLDDFNKRENSIKKAKKSSMFDGFEGKMTTIDDPSPDPIQMYMEEEARRMAKKKESEAPSPELYTHEAYSTALNRYEMSAVNSPEMLNAQFHSSNEFEEDNFGTDYNEEVNNDTVVENDLNNNDVTDISLNTTTDTNIDTAEESIEDNSGLEEFTMDMAAAVEQANPNLHNSQIPKNTESSYDLPLQNQTINEEINILSDDTSNKTNDDGYYLITDGNEPNAGLNVHSEVSENIDLDSINLDDLEDNDIENSINTNENIGENQDISSEIDNFLNSDDIDLSGVDIENIDTADLNIDEFTNALDLTDDNKFDDNNQTQSNAEFDNSELSFFDDNQSVNTEELSVEGEELPSDTVLSDIPDVSENQEEFENIQNEFFSDDAQNEEEYIPDFSQNDQNTIEQLYDDNNINQNQDEAMDQTFDANNIGLEPPPVSNVPVKKKSSLPFLLIVLFIAFCAVCYLQKDFIMQKINELIPSKKPNIQRNPNMPIEGENPAENTGMMNENNSEGQNPEENENTKQQIGDIPGEAGGPQDAKSMEDSLNQKASLDETTQTFKKEPQPLLSKEIKRLYWEIPQDLTYNSLIVNYLKNVGKTAKFAIKSDLLNTTEFPYSNRIIVNIIIKNDGSVDKVELAVPSGSKQIDELVLQSVKAALKYVKAPTSEFTKESYEFSLIINF